MSNEAILKFAKEKISLDWGQAIVGGLVMLLVSAASGLIPFGSLILTGPLMLGYAIWGINIVRNDWFKLDNLFEGFKNFGNSLATFLLSVLFILLWTLLLIIPGIIKALAYSQALFILADEPDLAAMDALRKSEAMMNGNKTKFFLLHLVFMLLSIACIFTLGIGFLFLFPYIQVTKAKFYIEVRKNYYAQVGDSSEN